MRPFVLLLPASQQSNKGIDNGRGPSSAVASLDAWNKHGHLSSWRHSCVIAGLLATTCLTDRPRPRGSSRHTSVSSLHVASAPRGGGCCSPLQMLDHQKSWRAPLAISWRWEHIHILHSAAIQHRLGVFSHIVSLTVQEQIDVTELDCSQIFNGSGKSHSCDFRWVWKEKAQSSLDPFTEIGVCQIEMQTNRP